MTPRQIFVMSPLSDDFSGAKRVKIVDPGEGENVQLVSETGPDVEFVKVVQEDADESLVVDCPERLPFLVKVEVYGPPPCPDCGTYLEGNVTQRSLGCPQCKTEWPMYRLDLKYGGKIWRRKGA